MSRIIMGDALEVLASLDSQSMDCVITDIAYESLEKHRKKGTTTRLSHSKGSSNDWFETFPNKKFPELLRELFRVMKPHTHLYLFTDDETQFYLREAAQDAGFYFWNNLIWVKTTKTEYKLDLEHKKGKVEGLTYVMSECEEHKDGSPRFVGSRLKGGMGWHWTKTKEIIMMFGRGPKLGKRDKRQMNDQSLLDVMFASSPKSKYPTQKPLSLYEAMIINSTHPGEIVLDPFSGAGTCAMAAEKLGREYVISDISQDAIDWSVNDLKQTYGSHPEIESLEPEPVSVDDRFIIDESDEEFIVKLLDEAGIWGKMGDLAEHVIVLHKGAEGVSLERPIKISLQDDDEKWNTLLVQWYVKGDVAVISKIYTELVKFMISEGVESLGLGKKWLSVTLMPIVVA